MSDRDPRPHDETPPSAKPPLKVLYVGGVPRSGSTLTDLLLHHLPGHVGVGETFYLWDDCLNHDSLCSCGRPFSACDFWREVGESSFGGWHNVNVDEVLRLQDVVDRSSAVPLLVAPRRSHRFQRALDRYTEIVVHLYRGILKTTGDQVIVDSSKRPSLAFILRAASEIDLRVAHVVRDPRGVAHSFAKTVDLEPGTRPRDQMPRSTTRKVARRWVTVNAMVASLARFGVPYVQVRYEDLVHDPYRELARVLALDGRQARGDEFDFISDGAFNIPETHIVAGGRIRLLSGHMAIRRDDAWTRDMPSRARRVIEITTYPSRRRYGYR